jgi:hypothetical protein
MWQSRKALSLLRTTTTTPYIFANTHHPSWPSTIDNNVVYLHFTFVVPYSNNVVSFSYRLLCELNQLVHPNRSYSKSTQHNSSRCATTRGCYVQFHGNSKGASIGTLGAKSLLVGNFHMKLILLQFHTLLRKQSRSKMDEYHMLCILFCSAMASFHSPTHSHQQGDTIPTEATDAILAFLAFLLLDNCHMNHRPSFLVRRHPDDFILRHRANFIIQWMDYCRCWLWRTYWY